MVLFQCLGKVLKKSNLCLCLWHCVRGCVCVGGNLSVWVRDCLVHRSWICTYLNVCQKVFLHTQVSEETTTESNSRDTHYFVKEGWLRRWDVSLWVWSVCQTRAAGSAAQCWGEIRVELCAISPANQDDSLNPRGIRARASPDSGVQGRVHTGCVMMVGSAAASLQGLLYAGGVTGNVSGCQWGGGGQFRGVQMGCVMSCTPG